MKQEQVIELAKQAGFSVGQGIGQLRINGYADDLARFASLVEQATLERAAKACEAVEATYERVHNSRSGLDEYQLSKSLECSEKILNLAKEPQ